MITNLIDYNVLDTVDLTYYFLSFYCILYEYYLKFETLGHERIQSNYMYCCIIIMVIIYSAHLNSVHNVAFEMRDQNVILKVAEALG